MSRISQKVAVKWFHAAVSGPDACPKCRGTGFVNMGECPRCGGSGVNIDWDEIRSTLIDMINGEAPGEVELNKLAEYGVQFDVVNVDDMEIGLNVSLPDGDAEIVWTGSQNELLVKQEQIVDAAIKAAKKGMLYSSF